MTHKCFNFTKDSEWGPWVTHDDGGGDHLKGYFVQVKTSTRVRTFPSNWRQINSTTLEGKVMGTTGGSWRSDKWRKGLTKVVEYRVRKPQGLTMLEEMVNSLPADKKQGELVYEGNSL